MKTSFCDPVQAERRLLLRRWEGNELTDEQLFEAMLAVSAGQWRFRKRVTARELDRKLRERER